MTSHNDYIYRLEALEQSSMLQVSVYNGSNPHTSFLRCLKSSYKSSHISWFRQFVSWPVAESTSHGGLTLLIAVSSAFNQGFGNGQSEKCTYFAIFSATSGSHCALSSPKYLSWLSPVSRCDVNSLVYSRWLLCGKISAVSLYSLFNISMSYSVRPAAAMALSIRANSCAEGSSKSTAELSLGWSSQ